MGPWDSGELLEEIWPETRHKRCWVHKTANVLNKMPKSIQSKAMQDIHSIWLAEGKEDANKAFNLFLDKYVVKYEQAANCLAKDRQELVDLL